MLILNNQDAAALLPMKTAIEQLEQAYIDMIEGRAVCRVSTGLKMATDNPDESYQFGTTDGGCGSGYFAIRMMSDIRYVDEVDGVRRQEKYCVKKGTYCGLILLFNVNNGEPLALMNDGYLQQMRVGADAAIGVKYMSNPECQVVGMFGAGGMARSHIEAIREVRNIDKVQVYDPVLDVCKAFARDIERRFGIETVITPTPEGVYKGADIVAECTNALDAAIVLGRHLGPGTHIVSIGRRLDEDAFQKTKHSLRFGNATAPMGKPEVTEEHWTLVAPAMAKAANKHTHSPGFAKQMGGEKLIYLADILKGGQGRMSPDDITHSERGNIMGAQFYPLAGSVYEAATKKSVGKEIPTEWLLQNIRN